MRKGDKLMKKIAIDGPAGAGKSTIAKEVSKRLGFIYVDTGALYRAIGFYALTKGADTKSENEVSALLSEIEVKLAFENGEQCVYLNGENVNSKIRTGEVSMAASNVSALPSVRAFLFDLQRNIADENNVVMDGRDIGTVVLPDADVKIFLTASPEARAKRRVLQMREKGIEEDYEKVLSEVKQRDYNDSHREIAPLKPTEESIIVDTTSLTLQESIDLLYKEASERI
jgi:cytidylate kinase